MSTILFIEFLLWDRLYNFFHRVSNAVKHLIHQLRILLVRDVGNDLLAGTGHPAGLGVGGAAAGENQDADIGPTHGVKIALESVSGPFVVKVGYVVAGGPLLPVGIYVFPEESAFAVGRVAEIKYLVSLLAELLYHLGLVGVLPAGGYVYLGHNQVSCFALYKDIIPVMSSANNLSTFSGKCQPFQE